MMYLVTVRTYRTRPHRIVMHPRTTAACMLLLLATGCPKQPEFSMEAPGRPALTWHNDDTDATEKPVTDAAKETETERALLAEYRESERQGSDDLAMARTLSGLALLRRQQGDLAEAEQFYRRALTIRERKQGPNDPDVAATLNNLGGVLAAQGNYDAAQPALERALTVRQAALGSDHELTAESLNNLALLYAAQGNAEAAEPLYQRAVAVLEKNGPAQKDGLDRVLDNYAALLDDTGRDSEAATLKARARSLRDASGQPAGAAPPPP
jgi:tetratricopeptide (TPR) repeat protein